MNIKIYTNYKPRQLLYWDDLTPKEQSEFDYTGMEAGSYFKYKNNVYTLGDFMRPEPAHFPQWAGYLPDSFFSGVLVKFTEDTEQIIVGTYIG